MPASFAMIALLLACILMNAAAITAELQSANHVLQQPGQDADQQVDAGTAGQQALAAPAFPTNNSVLQTAVDGAT